ncbi:hypothetical protein AAGS61_05105 [Lysinibacillus sp. KU-BSD001]|uniref:hypothetical protein n=1 Tax=Lysinibacillus sp. KU-BSD001 TaxID=3141328 RepID=UPI0036F1813A
MKKLYLVGLLLVVMVISTFFYRQHQLIKDYRALLYNQLYIIQKPIERILIFQKTAEQYKPEQRVQLIEPLYDTFTDIANHTGGGLQMEPHIKEQYFMDYLDTKNKYVHSVNAYIEAGTSEEREEAHMRLKEQYETYQNFLKKAETELIEPFE